LIPRQVIDEILSRSDIEPLIASYVSLKRAGSNLKGLCPFHSEKSPSFTVFPADNSFYCFGCGVGGNAITFVRQIEHLDYPDAVKFLAKRAGIQVVDDGRESDYRKDGVSKERLLAMNVEAAKYFHRALFADTVLTNYGIHFTTMEDDFGIVPVPKYDESQENYKSYLGYTIPMMFITNNTENPERTGTILEAFCTSSYDHVYPKMYEVVTKLKNARDEDSSEMIDIIIRNKIIDPLHFYNITGYGNFGRNLVVEKNANVSSKLKSYEKVAAKEWDKIMAAFEGIKK